MTNIKFSTNSVSNTFDYLAFINEIKLPVKLISLISQCEHNTKSLSGWQGLKSFVCQDRYNQIYDIDIRYAWEQAIFQQNLFDYGWTLETILYRKSLIFSSQKRHKIIIYLCETSINLGVKQKIDIVEDKFLIGKFWETITHVYLQLPCQHPFELPLLQTDENLIKVTTSNYQKETYQKSLTPHPKRKGEGGLRTKGLYKQSTSDKPLISVITVVYNGEKYLEQTIQSIINQSYENIEYIIIDGGSNDKTLEIIQKYEASIDYWVSEPDKGIYDAMNKGTSVASGSHTLHINADDLLCLPDSLELEFKQVNYLRGQIMVLLEEQVAIKRMPKKVHPNRYINMMRLPVFHQSFIGLKTENSYFDSSYKIIGDNILISQKLSQEPIDICSKIISIHRGGGVSADSFKILQELWQAVDKTNFPALLCLIRFHIYCYLREVTKLLGLVKFKRKYLS